MQVITDVKRAASQARHISADARKVLRNTYLLLGLTLLPTIAGSALFLVAPFTLALGVWGHLIAFLVVMFGMQAWIVANRHSVKGVYLLLLFTLFMGYFIGPMIGAALSFSNGVDIIAMAFGGTAATFLVLAGYATTTTKNFAAPGLVKTLFIGMFMAFGLSIVGVIFNIPGLSLAISVVFIPIASGFIVVTLNNIVRGGERNYILATMTVYIMLLNIFQSLLHLLMAFAGSRD